MQLQLVQNGVRFSDEHMEAVRQHFKDAQQYADNSSGLVDGENKNGIKLLIHTWGDVIGQQFRDLAEETELPLPDWRVVAACLFLGASLIIFGIYLLPL